MSQVSQNYSGNFTGKAKSFQSGFVRVKSVYTGGDQVINGTKTFTDRIDGSISGSAPKIEVTHDPNADSIHYPTLANGLGPGTGDDAPSIKVDSEFNYNPYTGTLQIPNLIVNGTTTTINSTTTAIQDPTLELGKSTGGISGSLFSSILTNTTLANVLAGHAAVIGPLATTGGSGTGLTLKLTYPDNATAITEIHTEAEGTGYVTDDIITISAASIQAAARTASDREEITATGDLTLKVQAHDFDIGDRGLVINHNDGNPNKTFFGFDYSDNKWLCLVNATETNRTWSGDKGTIKATLEGSISAVDNIVMNTFILTDLGIGTDATHSIRYGQILLNDTTLATNVVTSSLTAVGTIVTGSWEGSPINDQYLQTISTADKVFGSSIQLATTSAIENNTGLRIKDTIAGGCLDLTNQILNVKYATDSAIKKDIASDGLHLKTSLAGIGLTLTDNATNQILSVNPSQPQIIEIGTAGTNTTFSGPIISNQDFIVNTDKFTIDHTTGNTVIAGTISANDNVTIAANKTLTVNDANTFEVNGVAGNTKIGGTLTTTGLSSLNGGIEVNGTKFTVDSTTGNTAIEGIVSLKNNVSVSDNKTFIVGTGATTLGGSLSVTGNATVTGTTTLSSTLDVTGNTTLTGTTTLQSTLTASGDLTVNTGAFKVDAANSRVGINNATPACSLDITGTDGIRIPLGTSAQRPATPLTGHIRYNTDDATFEGYGAGNAWGSLGGVKSIDSYNTIIAEDDNGIKFYTENGVGGGVMTLRMSIDNTGLVNINDSLTVASGLSKLNGGIDVLNSGVSKFKVDTSGNTTVVGTHAVSGTTTLNDTLTVSGNHATSLGGTLNVDGAATLNNTLTVSGNNATILEGTLRVDSITTFKNNTFVSDNNAFNVSTGPTSLGGSLSVTGNTILTGTTTLKDTVTLSDSAALIVSGTTTLQSTLTASGDITVNTSAFKVDAANSRVGINNATPACSLDITGTDGIRIPLGTSAQRPATPLTGHIRYNTDDATFEGYGAGNAWGSLGGVKSINGYNTIIAEDGVGVKFYTENAGATDKTERITLLKDGTLNVLSPVSTNLGGTLDVTGNTTVNGTTTLKDTVTLSDSAALIVSGTTTLQSTLTASGDLTVNTGAFKVDATNSRVGINKAAPACSLDITGTDGIRIPAGTTVQRPATPLTGHIRYNTDDATFEGYGTAWGSLGGVKSIDGYNTIIAEDDNGIKFYTENGVGGGVMTLRMSINNAGLVNINDSLTVASGISNLNGGIAVNTNEFIVASGTGNTTIGGTTTLNNTLTVSGAHATTLGGSLVVTGEATIEGLKYPEAPSASSTVSNTRFLTFTEGSSDLSWELPLGPNLWTEPWKLSSMGIFSETASVCHTLNVEYYHGIVVETTGYYRYLKIRTSDNLTTDASFSVTVKVYSSNATTLAPDTELYSNTEAFTDVSNSHQNKIIDIDFGSGSLVKLEQGKIYYVSIKRTAGAAFGLQGTVLVGSPANNKLLYSNSGGPVALDGSSAFWFALYGDDNSYHGDTQTTIQKGIISLWEEPWSSSTANLFETLSNVVPAKDTMYFHGIIPQATGVYDKLKIKTGNSLTVGGNFTITIKIYSSDSEINPRPDTTSLKYQATGTITSAQYDTMYTITWSSSTELTRGNVYFVGIEWTSTSSNFGLQGSNLTSGGDITRNRFLWKETNAGDVTLTNTNSQESAFWFALYGDQTTDGASWLNQTAANLSGTLEVASTSKLVGNVAIGGGVPGADELHVTGDIVATGSITPTSDDRIKYNETDVNNCLGIINKLRPQKYEKIKKKPMDVSSSVWIPTDAEWSYKKNDFEWIYEYGFVAQSVRDVPELEFLVNGSETNTNGDQTPLGLNYNGIFTLSVGAIKELDKRCQEQISSSTAAIHMFESRMTSIETSHSSRISSIDSLQEIDSGKINNLIIQNTDLESKISGVKTTSENTEVVVSELNNKFDNSLKEIDSLKNTLQILEHPEEQNGFIVSANKNEYDNKKYYSRDAIGADSALPVVSLSDREKDKSWFGVMCDGKVKNSGTCGIWVTNQKGDLESGDYVTTSSFPGYAQKQDSDNLHNYTVAKITRNVNFIPPVGKKRVYKNGVLTNTTVFEPVYNVKYLNSSGHEISLDDYTLKKLNGQYVFIAAYVGCIF